ncbi:MAG: ComF family protein [Candidatus Geothermincolia bacterium]
MGYLQWLAAYILELIYPTSCAGCGVCEGDIFCGSCRGELIPLLPPLCPRCATPTRQPSDRCADCRRHRPAFDATLAVALYREPLRSAVHRLKFQNGRRLVPPFGELMAERAAHLAGRLDLVTFVPMERRRRRERGYNQAELLARDVAGRLGLPLAETLTKTRATEAQSGLSLGERRRNLERAVESEPVAARQRVLLVDDVMTSGSTFSECARALKRAGAASVTCLALARDLPELEAARAVSAAAKSGPAKASASAARGLRGGAKPGSLK